MVYMYLGDSPGMQELGSGPGRAAAQDRPKEEKHFVYGHICARICIYIFCLVGADISASAFTAAIPPDPDQDATSI